MVLENCSAGLLDWQRRQNGTLQDLDQKMDAMLLHEAERKGSINTLKWVAALVGASGIVNIAISIAQVVGG